MGLRNCSNSFSYEMQTEPGLDAPRAVLCLYSLIGGLAVERKGAERRTQRGKLKCNRKTELNAGTFFDFHILGQLRVPMLPTESEFCCGAQHSPDGL